ncbi:MAG: type II secretion system GspH family protein [Burkholderiales bacterium]|nr:type II secretion system GspH family protein [Burkholderiales bacterium]
MRRNQGFSTIEALVALFILGIVIVFTAKLSHSYFQTREASQVANQIKVIENLAIQYINESDTYLQLLKQHDSQDLFIPSSKFIPIASAVGGVTRYNQAGCIYIPQGTTEAMDAYLFFGNISLPLKAIDDKQINVIFTQLGGNAGILESNPTGSDFIVKGNLLSGYTVSPSTANNISTGCNFINGLSINSFIIDLSSDKKSFSQLKIKNTSPGDDPSFNRSHVDLLQTNISLDTTIQESSITADSIHAYKALDLGSVMVNGLSQRAQIQNNESIAIQNNTNQLSVSSAGIVAAQILPKSQKISVGDACDKTLLGTVAQEQFIDTGVINGGQTVGISGGQLICTYNISACTNQYCYLPSKPSTISYAFPIEVSNYSCNSGMFIASPQSDFVDTNISCPSIAGYVSQFAHATGNVSNCYNNQGNTYCTGYNSYCSYVSNFNPSNVQNFPVPAIKKVTCTNDISAVLIDNYKQN